jgi:hypothetical protein
MKNLKENKRWKYNRKIFPNPGRTNNGIYTRNRRDHFHQKRGIYNHLPGNQNSECQLQEDNSSDVLFPYLEKKKESNYDDPIKDEYNYFEAETEEETEVNEEKVEKNVADTWLNEDNYHRGYGLEGSQVYNVYEYEFRNDNSNRTCRRRRSFDDD